MQPPPELATIQSCPTDALAVYGLPGATVLSRSPAPLEVRNQTWMSAELSLRNVYDAAAPPDFDSTEP